MWQATLIFLKSLYSWSGILTSLKFLGLIVSSVAGFAAALPEPLNKSAAKHAQRSWLGRRMPQRLEADREMAKQLWIQGLKVSKISELTGVNPKTIRTWSNRDGWSKIASDASTALEQTGENALAVQVARSMADRSEAIPSKLASVVEDQADLLVQNPASKVSQLENSPTGQGHASVVKTVTETASMVFGWKEPPSQVGPVRLEATSVIQRRSDLPAVEAEVVSAEGGS